MSAGSISRRLVAALAALAAVLAAASCAQRERARISSLSVEPSLTAFYVGERASFAARASSQGAPEGSGVEYEWECSDPEVVSGLSGGAAASGEASAAGRATVRVAARLVGPDGRVLDSASASAPVQVALRRGPNDGPSDAASALPASLRREVGSSSDAVWSSSDPSVARVDPRTGRVEPVGEGTAEISVSYLDGSRRASFVLDVSVPVASVSVSGAPSRLAVGLSAAVEASFLPEDATDGSLAWSSSEPGAVGVSWEDGGSRAVVSALAEGESVVTATALSGASASFRVSSLASIPVESVSLSPSSLSLRRGARARIAAASLPADATAAALAWSSSSQAVRILSAGPSGCDVEVSALPGAPAEAVLEAKAPSGASASCLIRAVDVAAESVSLSPASLSLASFEPAALGFAVLPADCDDPSVSWSSSAPGVVSVNAGVVRLLRLPEEGEPNPVLVTATASSGVSASCEVSVDVPVASISLSAPSLRLEPGARAALSAVLLPANHTRSSAVLWSSSDPSVARVLEGAVEALAPGRAVITARSAADPSLSASCPVLSARVLSLSAPGPSSPMRAGSSAAASASVSAEPAGGDVGAVEWSSSDPSVVSAEAAMPAVSSEGAPLGAPGAGAMLRALAPGRAVITARSAFDPSFSASFGVEVARVSSLSLSAPSLRLDPGSSAALSASVSAEPAGAPVSAVAWSSSAPRTASVSPDGVVAALSPGRAVITARSAFDPSLSASCEVIVSSGVSSVALSDRSVSVRAGRSAPLSAFVESVLSGPRWRAVEWSVS
ncbi:MAG TPA: hypothetical protein DCO86_01525, partial [Spirochaetaceae bacterium]|nr:hypothetical protein [Spirochaetaceae bacterium]